MTDSPPADALSRIQVFLRDWADDGSTAPTADVVDAIETLLDTLAAFGRLHAVEPELVEGQLVESDPIPFLYCLACLGEQYEGKRETPNEAVTIVTGQTSCREHLHFAPAPIVPGRTPGGIILNGG